MRGIVEDSFSLSDQMAKRSDPTRLPMNVLESSLGLPIVPERSCWIFFRWLPETRDGTVTLLLEELSIPQSEYREFLERKGTAVQPVYLVNP